MTNFTMKQIIFFLLFFISFESFAQRNYWQQKLDYTIDVSLDDKAKSLNGTQTIVYKNNSPDTLHYIWFHIWPNAYFNDSTALLKQIRNDPSITTKLDKFEKGYITGLNFKVDKKSATTLPHSNPQYIDIIKLNLPEPLLPGASATIETFFKVKLPSYFSRMGYAENEFMICQWYPKPAVYDKTGWHEFPYLDMGEFYSEYGDYKVNITLPADYIVGATGELQTSEELEQYKTIGRKNTEHRNESFALYKPKAGTKTLSYIAKNVPDFAWFADKGTVIQYDTIQLKSGKIVDAFTYFKNKKNTIWKNSIDYIKDGTRKYSEWIGEYEYPTVQAFEGPKNNASGGMEYPMITLITDPDATVESLDGVITHEVGHNWFMSMLGNNERKNPWQDEGLNTYFQFRYEAEKYRYNSIFKDSIPQEVKALPLVEFQSAIYGALGQIPMQTPIETPSEKFGSFEDYGLIAYIKTAIWVYILEATFGRESVDRAFQYYFNEWKNKHPQPIDMKTSFEKALGRNLDNYFKLLKKEDGFL